MAERKETWEKGKVDVGWLWKGVSLMDTSDLTVNRNMENEGNGS